MTETVNAASVIEVFIMMFSSNHEYLWVRI